MQLATSEITIRLDGEAIRLRPTLRAALRLERRHGGFDAIARAVSEGSLTVIADVIQESAQQAFVDVETLLEVGPVQGVLTALAPAILAHVFALAGVDDDSASSGDTTTSRTVKNVTWADHHRSLYKLATGWLSWTPDQAWNATPAEILTAYEGRLDMLKAIFGEGDNKASAQPELSLDDKFALVFGGFSRKREGA